MTDSWAAGENWKHTEISGTYVCCSVFIWLEMAFSGVIIHTLCSYSTLVSPWWTRFFILQTFNPPGFANVSHNNHVYCNYGRQNRNLFISINLNWFSRLKLPKSTVCPTGIPVNTHTVYYLFYSLHLYPAHLVLRH